MYVSTVFLWWAVVGVPPVFAHALDVMCLHQHGEHGFASSNSRQRHLKQAIANSDFTLRRIDFSNLPAVLDDDDPFEAGESPLVGNITLTTNTTNELYDVPSGAFQLGPDEAKQIFAAVTTQLVRSRELIPRSSIIKPWCTCPSLGRAVSTMHFLAQLSWHSISMTLLSSWRIRSCVVGQLPSLMHRHRIRYVSVYVTATSSTL
jgi:hypothetical protein